MRWCLVGLGAAVTLAGCRTQPFGCEDDDQCQVDVASGTCEANGYCSFDDPDCESGRRYGELAGGGLAGLCVNDVPETTGAGSSSSSGLATTTVNPMTGLTTDLTTDSGSTSRSSTSGETSVGSSGGESSSSSNGSGSTGGLTLEDGLVVFVPFEDPPMDDGSLPVAPGTLAVICEQGLAACPDVVPGVVGNAGHFDGVADVLIVADDPRLHFEDGFTLALWVRWTEAFDPYAIVAGKAFGNGSANSYELYLSAYDPETLSCNANFNTDAGPPSAFASTDLSQTWTHIAGVWGDGLWRLYVDGAQVTADVLESPPSYDARPFAIGADTEDGEIAGYFGGDLDEIRLYDRPLSEDEVQQLAGLR